VGFVHFEALMDTTNTQITSDKPEKKPQKKRRAYKAYCMDCDCFLGLFPRDEEPLWCPTCKENLPD
jgi:hypothetical protein